MAHVITESMRIQVPSFKVTTHYEAEVVLMAVQNYGHLIRCVPRREVSFSEFAAEIVKHYDTTTPQTGEVVRVLKELSALN